MRAREYAPGLGSFTAPDPAGPDITDDSAYDYAADNPAAFTDPKGLQPHVNELPETPTDIFGFASLTRPTAEIPDVGALEIEGVGLVGYSNEGGAYTGSIGAGGGKGGGDSDYLASFSGKETTSSDPCPTSIDLREGSLGPQAIVAGIGVGIGDYTTGKGEHGYFAYAGGGIVDFDFPVGFGLSDSAIQALISPPAY